MHACYRIFHAMQPTVQHHREKLFWEVFTAYLTIYFIEHRLNSWKIYTVFQAEGETSLGSYDASAMENILAIFWNTFDPNHFQFHLLFEPRGVSLL